MDSRYTEDPVKRQQKLDRQREVRNEMIQQKIAKPFEYNTLDYTGKRPTRFPAIADAWQEKLADMVTQHQMKAAALNTNPMASIGRLSHGDIMSATGQIKVERPPKYLYTTQPFSAVDKADHYIKNEDERVSGEEVTLTLKDGVFE